MTFFRRNQTSLPPAAAGGFAAAHAGSSRHGDATCIAPGSRIKGQLGGSTEILIEGEVEGEVRVEATVVVGPRGVVRGPITAPVIKVAGRVHGNLFASERVEVGPEGTVEGDIAAPRVVIAEGAFFAGRVEMESDPRRESPAPQPAPGGPD